MEIIILFRQIYGTKKNIVKVISKYPLARYRAEFDPRTKERREIDLDIDTVNLIKMTLNTLKTDKYEDDWVIDHDSAISNSINTYLVIFNYNLIGDNLTNGENNEILNQSNFFNLI